MKFTTIDQFENKVIKLDQRQGLEKAVDYVTRIYHEIKQETPLNGNQIELLTKYPHLEKNQSDRFILLVARLCDYRRFNYTISAGGQSVTGAIYARNWREFFSQIEIKGAEKLNVVRRNI